MTDKPASRPNRNLLAGALIALSLLPLLLPPPYGLILFGAAVFVALFIGTRTYRVRQTLVASLRHYADTTPGQWLLFGAGCAALVAASVRFYASVNVDETFNLQARLGLVLFVLGGVLLAWVRLRPVRDQVSERMHSARYNRRHIGALVAALGLLATLTIINARRWDVLWLPPVSHHLQVIGFAVVVALLVYGVAGRSTPATVDDRWRVQRREWWAIGGIAGVALMLRFWQLDAVQWLLDEHQFLSLQRYFWRFPDVAVLTPMTGLSPYSWLFPYLQTWGAEIFGRNMTGIRAVSALFGTLNVVGMWWLARHLFDRRTALLAAVLLVGFPAHVHFSRDGIPQVGDLLFGTLALAWGLRAWRTGRRLDFALAGAMLGLSQYFYEGGRLAFPVIMAVWLGYVLLLNRRRWRELLPNVGVLVGVAVVVALPFYVNTLLSTWAFAERLAQSGQDERFWQSFIDGERDLTEFIDHVLSPFLLYFARSDTSFHYAGEQALTPPLMVPLLLLGFWLLLRRMLRGAVGAALVLLWVLGVAAGNVLLDDPSWTSRHVIVLPALVLTVTAGIAFVAGWLRERLNGRLVAAAQVMLVVFFFGWHTTYYFGEHIHKLYERIYENVAVNDHHDAMLRAVEYPPGTRTTLIMNGHYPADYNAEFMRYLSDAHPIITLDGTDLTDDYFPGLPRYIDHLFILPIGHPAYEQIVAEYDLGPPSFSTHPYTPVDEQFALYHLPAEIPSEVRVVPADARQSREIRLLLACALAIVGAAVLTHGDRRRWFAGAGIVALLLVTYDLTYGTGSALTVVLGVGGVVSLFGVTREGAVRARETWQKTDATTFQSGWIVAAGGMALAALTAINVIESAQVPAWLQIALLPTGAGLVVVGMAGWRQKTNAVPRLDVVLIVGVLLLAFALRTVNLEGHIHRHVDELASVASLLELRDDPALKLLQPYEGVAAFSRTYTVLQSLTVDMLGTRLTGLRFISALFGTATVAAVYLLGRVYFDRRTALLAALALTVFPPHLHFSRIGINNVVDPFFGTLALAFLGRGLGRGTRLDFALAGAMLGLTGYWYEGGRLLYPVLALGFVGLHFLTARQVYALRRLAVTAFVALIVAAPPLLTLTAQGLPLAPRLDDTARDTENWSRMIENGDLAGALLDPLAFYVTGADASSFYDAPLLLPVVLPLFLLGLVVTFGLLRQRRGALLVLLWLGLVAAGNVLLRDTAQIPRYVAAFPVMALVVGVGMRYGARLLAGEGWRGGVLVGITAGVLVYAQVGYYFNGYATFYLRQHPFEAAVDDVFFRSARLPDNTHIRLVTDESLFVEDLYTVLDFKGRADDSIFMTTVTPANLQTELDGLSPGRVHTFFVSQYDRDAVETLAFFGARTQETSPFDVPPPVDYLMFTYIAME
jgi:4-amino-4-deoxy-L-arabinose transferase-like glycosyltransferase